MGLTTLAVSMGEEAIMGTGSPTTSTTYLMGGTPPTQFNFKDPAGLGSAPGAPKTMTVEVDGTTTTITLDEVVRDIDTLVAKLNEKFTAAGLDIKA